MRPIESERVWQSTAPNFQTLEHGLAGFRRPFRALLLPKRSIAKVRVLQVPPRHFYELGRVPQSLDADQTVYLPAPDSGGGILGGLRLGMRFELRRVFARQPYEGAGGFRAELAALVRFFEVLLPGGVHGDVDALLAHGEALAEALV